MKEKVERELDVTCFMVDSSYRMKASSFMEQAQEIAGDGADMLGCGYDVLRPKGLAWILTRMQWRYLRAPQWREKLTMRSWHKGVQGPYFVRDYEMLDAEGNRIAVGTSCWVILRLNERSVVRTQEMERLFDTSAQCRESAMENLAAKLAVPRGIEPDRVSLHRVTYSDMDFNSHANNTRYISWALDALPPGLCAEKAIREISINFHKEALLGDEVTLRCFRTEKKDGESWTVEGSTGGNSSFTAKITF